MLFLKSFSERIFTSFGVELLDRFKNMQVCSTVIRNLIGYVLELWQCCFLLVNHYFEINDIQDSDSVFFS